MRRPNSGRFQKKPSAGASNNGRIDGSSVCVCVCAQGSLLWRWLGKRCHMSYHYSAIPHFRELFHCSSYLRGLCLEEWWKGCKLDRAYKDTIKCVKVCAYVKVALEACTAIHSRPGNFKLMRLTVLSFRSLLVWNSTFQINQPTRCNNFWSLLLDVYVQLNMFRASSRPSSGAQQLQ